MKRFIAQPLTAVLSTLVVVVALSFGSIASAGAAEDVVTTKVAGPFDKVVTNLKRQVAAHKLIIIKLIPFQQMLRMVGVKAGKAIGLEIFHPRYGKVIFNNDKRAMIDVPLRMIVRAKGSDVMIMYRKPSAVFAKYSGLGDMAKELDGVFADMVKRVAQ